MSFEIKNLSGGYGKPDVCKHISCSISDGELLCVLGPNGCGKSTLFKLILGLIKKSSGDILYQEKSIFNLSERELAKIIAYIPQQHNPMFAFTVLEVVLFARTSHFKNFGSPTKNDVEQAKNALKKLEIYHLAHQNYTTLSGGQRQLVLIARALCQDAKILILDEPVANLDYANSQKVLSIINLLKKDGYIIIMSTHSPEQPFSCAEKVILMQNGEVFAYGTPFEVLTSENLYNVYTTDMDIVQVQDRNGTTHTLCVTVENKD
ncbi:MAG: ABC transporter ATP-binding protein [Clostridia bacterium]